ncbi:MAG TPA: YhjD/YihY/BrkB family envelope integrity protein [Acidimicrobiales bacterium]|jgi:YihY family inner membrane protein
MAEEEGRLGRTLQSIDDLQRSTKLTAVVVAVVKRYSDDRASRQAALITFYGFLSVFPLMLLVVTFAALLFGESTLHKDIVDSAFAQFPVIGDQLSANIHAIVRGNTLAVIAATLGLVWGSFGITNSLQSASAAVWRSPSGEDPSILARLRKGAALLGVLGGVAILSSVVAGVAANGVERFGVGGNMGRAVAFGAVLAANLGGYLLALRLLAPRGTAWRTILPGAVLGSVGWTILQVAGGWLIGHRLHHASQLYGLFAVVLGLIFWINLGAQLFLYASELNLVVTRHEWPRSIRSEAA